jgi:hypothetical protein
MPCQYDEDCPTGSVCLCLSALSQLCAPLAGASPGERRVGSMPISAAWLKCTSPLDAGADR